MTPTPPAEPANPPMFRSFPLVLGLILAALLIAHVTRVAAPAAAQNWAFFTFSVIPQRYERGAQDAFDGLLDAWLPLVGHAFLHGSWVHLGLNSLFLLQGGVPVARGLGAGAAGGLRFAALFAGTAIAGGLLYIALNAGSANPAVGASGAVCGVFGAYFIGARGHWRDSLADRQVRAGIAVFLAVNVGLAALARVAGVFPIAWEAHLGGFLAGLVLYPLLRSIH